MTKTTIEAAGEAVLATGIAARINGQTYYCEIHRADLRFFESLFGPALVAMNRIRNLEWDSEMIRAIVDFATGERPKADDTAESFRMTFITTSARRRAASSWIDEAFQKHGPLRYAPLAGLILAAALVGLPAEDATFDDEDI